MKEFEKNGKIYTRERDVNRKPNGHLSGTALRMNKAIYNLINHTNIELAEAVKTATVNPARLLGVYNKKGSIETGKDADLTVIDEDINIYMTLVEGEIKFKKSFN